MNNHENNHKNNHKNNYEIGGYYFAKIDKHNLFEGIIEILEIHNGRYSEYNSFNDDGIICEITTVFKTDNPVW